MKTRVSYLCRGSAKVFFKLSIDDVDPNDQVGFSAFLNNHTEVPCMVFDLNDSCLISAPSALREFIIALPLLKTSIRFFVFQLNAQGSVIQESKHDILPAIAQVASFVNGRQNKTELAKVRNADIERTGNRICFDFLQAIPLSWCEKSNMILQGIMTLPAHMESEIKTIRCFDDNFRQIGSEAVIYELPHISNSDQDKCHLGFSVQVTRNFNNLTVAAVDGKGSYVGGFATLDEPKCRQLLHNAEYLYEGPGYMESFSQWWRERYLDRATLEREKKTTFQKTPLFSIIVPLYRTPLALFWEMLNSVLEQTYGNWELILVNASPDDDELKSAVKHAAELDERVVVIDLEDNRGITLNTNEGILRAKGDFISFFDHDDVLAPGLLFAYAKALNEYEDIDLLYCDEIKLNMDGLLIEPNFKPDFSLDMLLNNNYVCHMLTIRASLLRSLPLQGSEFDGAQDHNLTLMVSEVARRIYHVPEVLYLWRMAPHSTASDPSEKSYAAEAGKKAIRAHLKRRGVQADVVDDLGPFRYKVVYELQGNPLVSLIVVSKDDSRIRQCVNALLDVTTYAPIEIVVVSQDGSSCDYSDDRVRTVQLLEHNTSIAAARNCGASQAKGEYLVFVDESVEAVDPAWLSVLLGICQQGGVGAAAPLVCYPDGTFYNAGEVLTSQGLIQIQKGYPEQFRERLGRRNWNALSGACLMIPGNVFQAVGGFDEEFEGETCTADLCLKLREDNLHLVFAPDTIVKLYGMPFTPFDFGYEEDALAMNDWIRFFNHWKTRLSRPDEYFNERLTSKAPFGGYYHIDIDRAVRG